MALSMRDSAGLESLADTNLSGGSAESDEEPLYIPKPNESLKVSVHLVGARSLIAAKTDYNTGLIGGKLETYSDPYVILGVDDVFYSSSVVFADCNPVWDEKFEFYNCRTSSKIVLSIRHQDVFDNNSLLGTVTLPLQNMVVRQEQDYWIPLAKEGLYAEDKSISCGAVHLRLRLSVMTAEERLDYGVEEDPDASLNEQISTEMKMVSRMMFGVYSEDVPGVSVRMISRTGVWKCILKHFKDIFKTPDALASYIDSRFAMRDHNNDGYLMNDEFRLVFHDLATKYWAESQAINKNVEGDLNAMCIKYLLTLMCQIAMDEDENQQAIKKKREEAAKADMENEKEFQKLRRESLTRHQSVASMKGSPSSRKKSPSQAKHKSIEEINELRLQDLLTVAALLSRALSHDFPESVVDKVVLDISIVFTMSVLETLRKTNDPSQSNGNGNAKDKENKEHGKESKSEEGSDKKNPKVEDSHTSRLHRLVLDLYPGTAYRDRKKVSSIFKILRFATHFIRCFDANPEDTASSFAVTLMKTPKSVSAPELESLTLTEKSRAGWAHVQMICRGIDRGVIRLGVSGGHVSWHTAVRRIQSLVRGARSRRVINDILKEQEENRTNKHPYAQEQANVLENRAIRQITKKVMGGWTVIPQNCPVGWCQTALVQHAEKYIYCVGCCHFYKRSLSGKQVKVDVDKPPFHRNFSSYITNRKAVEDQGWLRLTTSQVMHTVCKTVSEYVAIQKALEEEQMERLRQGLPYQTTITQEDIRRVNPRHLDFRSKSRSKVDSNAIAEALFAPPVLKDRTTSSGSMREDVVCFNADEIPENPSNWSTSEPVMTAGALVFTATAGVILHKKLARRLSLASATRRASNSSIVSATDSLKNRMAEGPSNAESGNEAAGVSDPSPLLDKSPVRPKLDIDGATRDSPTTVKEEDGRGESPATVKPEREFSEQERLVGWATSLDLSKPTPDNSNLPSTMASEGMPEGTASPALSAGKKKKGGKKGLYLGGESMAVSLEDDISDVAPIVKELEATTSPKTKRLLFELKDREVLPPRDLPEFRDAFGDGLDLEEVENFGDFVSRISTPEVDQRDRRLALISTKATKEESKLPKGVFHTSVNPFLEPGESPLVKRRITASARKAFSRKKTTRPPFVIPVPPKPGVMGKMEGDEPSYDALGLERSYTKGIKLGGTRDINPDFEEEGLQLLPARLRNNPLLEDPSFKRRRYTAGRRPRTASAVSMSSVMEFDGTTLSIDGPQSPHSMKPAPPPRSGSSPSNTTKLPTATVTATTTTTQQVTSTTTTTTTTSGAFWPVSRSRGASQALSEGGRPMPVVPPVQPAVPVNKQLAKDNAILWRIVMALTKENTDLKANAKEQEEDHSLMKAEISSMKYQLRNRPSRKGPSATRSTELKALVNTFVFKEAVEQAHYTHGARSATELTINNKRRSTSPRKTKDRYSDDPMED